MSDLNNVVSLYSIFRFLNSNLINQNDSYESNLFFQHIPVDKYSFKESSSDPDIYNKLYQLLEGPDRKELVSLTYLEYACQEKDTSQFKEGLDNLIKNLNYIKNPTLFPINEVDTGLPDNFHLNCYKLHYRELVNKYKENNNENDAIELYITLYALLSDKDKLFRQLKSFEKQILKNTCI